MQDPNEIDPVSQRLVEDNVPTEGHAAQARRQLVASLAYHRLCGYQSQLAVESINPGIRLDDAVLGDVVSDLGNVGAGEWPTNDARHPMPWPCVPCPGA